MANSKQLSSALINNVENMQKYRRAWVARVQTIPFSLSPLIGFNRSKLYANKNREGIRKFMCWKNCILINLLIFMAAVETKRNFNHRSFAI